MSGSEVVETTLARPTSEPEHSVLLGFLPHASRVFRREPAVAITICYLLVAMAGIFYNYSYYSKFGIPILTLSQISDFLVAGLQQPMALVLVLSTFPLCWVIDCFNLYNRRKRARRRDALLSTPGDSRLKRVRTWLLLPFPRWLTGVAYVAITIIYGWLFVNAYAGHRAHAVKQGDAGLVTIWLSGDANQLTSEAQGRWTYLGAVSNYVFVYDIGAKRSVILPINNITRIEPVAAR
jgi:hypothetical protein